MEGYIYCITDTTNGKQYIGQHRYKKPVLDKTYHGSGVIISNIYKKRPETLKEEYLKTCYSQKELDEWEKYFIFTNNTLHPNGYNLTEGGGGGIPCEETRRKLSDIAKNISDEHRRKLSESAKGRIFSDETRKKLSENMKGKMCKEKHFLFGKHRSDETKNKISKSLKGQHPSDETRKKLSEIRKGRKLSEETKQKISDSKKGRCYLTDEQYRKIGEKIRGIYNTKSSKPVLQYTLDGEFVKEWPSMHEAERFGFSYRNISQCCKGEKKTHKGFIWKYEKEKEVA